MIFIIVAIVIVYFMLLQLLSRSYLNPQVFSNFLHQREGN